MLRTWSTLVLLLLVTSMAPLTAIAQTDGKIAGRVVDAETGEPLPGANVFLEGTTLGTAASVDGSYTIFGIPAGTYNVIASFVGYATERREGVEVIGGITTRLNFELPLTEIEGQVIEVVAERRDRPAERLGETPDEGVADRTLFDDAVEVPQAGFVVDGGNRVDDGAVAVEAVRVHQLGEELLCQLRALVVLAGQQERRSRRTRSR